MDMFLGSPPVIWNFWIFISEIYYHPKSFNFNKLNEFTNKFQYLVMGTSWIFPSVKSNQHIYIREANEKLVHHLNIWNELKGIRLMYVFFYVEIRGFFSVFGNVITGGGNGRACVTTAFYRAEGSKTPFLCIFLYDVKFILSTYPILLNKLQFRTLTIDAIRWLFWGEIYFYKVPSNLL